MRAVEGMGRRGSRIILLLKGYHGGSAQLPPSGLMGMS